MSNNDIERAARAMAESDGFCWENCAQSYWIDHARIAKEALRSRSMEWQPIETAPKDRTEILGAWDAPTPEYKARGVIFWDHDCWITAPGWFKKEPTHWQPLPQPPHHEQIAPEKGQ